MGLQSHTNNPTSVTDARAAKMPAWQYHTCHTAGHTIICCLPNFNIPSRVSRQHADAAATTTTTTNNDATSVVDSATTPLPPPALLRLYAAPKHINEALYCSPMTMLQVLRGFEPTAARTASIGTAGCANSLLAACVCLDADTLKQASPVVLPLCTCQTTQAHHCTGPPHPHDPSRFLLLLLFWCPVCWTPHLHTTSSLTSSKVLHPTDTTDCLSRGCSTPAQSI